MNCYTCKIDLNNEKLLKNFFEDDGADFSVQQYAFWKAKKNNYNAVFYNSGKLLIQGANIDEIAKKVDNLLGLDTQHPTTNDGTISRPAKRIGVDESGKGDFFGPLVIAGVMVDENNTELLVKAGVKDCKKIDDKNINKLAAIIKNNCTFSVVTINPAKYNELYAKFNNLNNLLAWGHARAIENILEKADCTYALSDKFGDEKLIQNALMDKGKKIHLEQQCKAESDIAVAAASIIARAQFLRTMADFSQKYSIEIPKGASEKVVQTAKFIKEKYSKEELSQIAKTHFKTYSQV